MATRLLACADLHGFRDVYAWLVERARTDKPDGVVLAGDLLGFPDGHGSVEEAQAADALEVVALLSEIECPVFYVMGNDDWVDLDPSVPNIQSVHGRRVVSGNFNVVGYQHTLPFMGGINEKAEHEMKKNLDELEDLVDQNTVLVTHGPAYGVRDRVTIGGHAGSTSLRDLVDRCSPRVHIHGQIHYWFAREGRHFNVASAGRKRAMLINLTTMEHGVVE
ncbi:MAG: metallophosphoesterase [Deltaproteobacteria bacterium]|jgi:Icc-related predicted phosphoesterase|nr:metallophosphoesterase [Deltaproteobacteria bacterium]